MEKPELRLTDCKPEFMLDAYNSRMRTLLLVAAILAAPGLLGQTSIDSAPTFTVPAAALSAHPHR
jgi:hypothetical protein